MSAVTTLLADTVALISESKSDLIARMTCPELSDLEMYVVEGVSCHPATESGLPPFKVYATRHFTSTPRFDCIEILLTETDANGNDIISNAFAQVLGILVVNCLGEDKCISSSSSQYLRAKKRRVGINMYHMTCLGI
jgi:hypothetical protein